MASFDELYRMQQGQNNPLINLQQMQARMPNWLTAPTPQSGNLGAARLFTEQMNRPSDMDLKQQTLDIERQRAKDVADIQMKTFQANLARQGQSNLSKTPTYIRNPETGDLQIIQLSSAGQPVTPELPEGYEPIRPMTYLNAGGEHLGIPYGGGTPEAVYPKTLTPEAEPATRAAQTTAVAQAKSQEEARQQLPGARMDLARIEKGIDEILSHPGMTTGWEAKLPVFPGSDRAGFESRREQLSGGAFLQGVQMLKGSGQVTEVEGLKAEASLLRASTAPTEKEYRAAMEDYRSAMRDGLKKIEIKAGDGVGGGWTKENQSRLDALRSTQGELQ
jgi:hypothetical protein